LDASWYGVIVWLRLISWPLVPLVAYVNYVWNMNLIFVMELYFPCMMWWCALLAICNPHVLHVGRVLPCLKTLGGIKCCVRFSVPKDLVMTLSPVWSCGKGSSSPVWSSGRGLVRVMYSLACAKQWGKKICFTLFRLVTSIVPSVRCIDVFTHNSLRNKGDSLAAIVGHIKLSISRKLDVVLG